MIRLAPPAVHVWIRSWSPTSQNCTLAPSGCKVLCQRLATECTRGQRCHMFCCSSLRCVTVGGRSCPRALLFKRVANFRNVSAWKKLHWPLLRLGLRSRERTLKGGLTGSRSPLAAGNFSVKSYVLYLVAFWSHRLEVLFLGGSRLCLDRSSA